MLGVSYHDFWDMNPKELKPFVKAFSLKQENLDNDMWIMGKYISLAIGSTMSKDCKYPNKSFLELAKIDRQAELKARFVNRMEELNTCFKEC